MNVRSMLAATAVMFAALMAVGAPAHAQERKMVVLIDASGSMAAPRDNSDGAGATRFEAARQRARQQVAFFAAQPGAPLRVAVYTFRGTNEAPVIHTNPGDNFGFIDPVAADVAIDCLVPAPPPFCAATHDAGAPFFIGGGTPLARALCEVVDVLGNPRFAVDTKLIQLSSDGEENTTLSGPCQGPNGVLDPTSNTYVPAESWQNRIITYVTGTQIAVRVDLFELEGLPLAPRAPDPEGIRTPEARALALAGLGTSSLSTLAQFFVVLTQATGGQLTIVGDDQPLPVSGDLNADRCVDRGDALLVARAFGPVAPPRDGRFDLNFDRVVDYTDYAIQRSLISTACGPDPFVSRAPIVCSGPGQVVIDGQAVEAGGITISVRSACQVIIRNSLIVSGQSGISIDGSAVVRVDNSIIVGPNAITGTRGTIILSAANTIFHGPLTTNGAFSYINRGGNTFE